MGEKKRKNVGAAVTLLAAILALGCNSTPASQGAPDAGGATRSSRARAINDSGTIVGQSSDGSGKLLAVAFAVSGAAPAYSVTEIGSLGGSPTSIAALSASGKATGVGHTAAGDAHAFLYAGAALVDLGVLSGDNASQGFALTDDGRVVGDSSAAGNSRAFLYQSGAGMAAVAAPDPQATSSSLRGINASGTMVGLYLSQGHELPFLSSSSSGPVSLASFLSGGYGAAINDSAEILFGSTVSGGGTAPYPAGPFHELASINGFTLPAALGANGDVVGRDRNGQVGYGSGQEEAVLYRAGAETLLGFAGDSGVVDLNGQITAADRASYTLTDATAVNASGWIACSTAQGKAVILKPR